MYASMSGRALKNVCAALWSRIFALDINLCVFRRGQGERFIRITTFRGAPRRACRRGAGGDENPNRKVAKVLYIDYNLDDVTNATIPPSSRGLGTATTLRDRHAAVDAARDA